MTADGLVRLAELRRRQGRLVEAAAIFEQAEPHALASLGRAELAFDRGDCESAAELGERYLRRLTMQNRTDRAAGLDLVIRARVALGDLEAARNALTELTAIATLMASVPLQATASVAAGCVSHGEGDLGAARRHLEDGVDLFRRSGAPFEGARARIALARVFARSRPRRRPRSRKRNARLQHSVS